MTRWSSNKDINALLRTAQAAGATITHRPGGHLLVRLPGAPPVFVPATPGTNNRSIDNVRAKLRRAMRSTR